MKVGYCLDTYTKASKILKPVKTEKPEVHCHTSQAPHIKADKGSHRGTVVHNQGCKFPYA